MKRKKILIGVICIIVAIVVLSKLPSLTNEPCDWCEESPSFAYDMSDGSKSYVCMECRTKCAWCGERAVKHYENGLHMMVFVCKDCYESLE